MHATRRVLPTSRHRKIGGHSSKGFLEYDDGLVAPQWPTVVVRKPMIKLSRFPLPSPLCFFCVDHYGNLIILMSCPSRQIWTVYFIVI